MCAALGPSALSRDSQFSRSLEVSAGCSLLHGACRTAAKGTTRARGVLAGKVAEFGGIAALCTVVDVAKLESLLYLLSTAKQTGEVEKKDFEILDNEKLKRVSPDLAEEICKVGMLTSCVTATQFWHHKNELRNTHGAGMFDVHDFASFWYSLWMGEELRCTANDKLEVSLGALKREFAAIVHNKNRTQNPRNLIQHIKPYLIPVMCLLF